MLRNFDNRLNADVIRCLRAMGHGDDIVICDTNFPADSVARHTVTGELLRMENLTATEAIDAILSVFPLDPFVEKPASRMEVVGKPAEITPVQQEVQAVIDKWEGKPWPMGAIERFAFYEKAKDAYAIIVTGETRFYGNFILKKGVVPPRG